MYYYCWMLNIQQYLRSGKTPSDLNTELGIISYSHPTLPLTGFKYHQLDSPKTHPIVKEARGIVLENNNWNIVGKAFDRFYNVGEDAENFSRFNWTDYHAYSKEDGSLFILYYYEGKWRTNTSGSFGFGNVGHTCVTWPELFWSASRLEEKTLENFKNLTFVFELCSLYNKIVRIYQSPKVYLLSAFRTEPETSQELSHEEVEELFTYLKQCSIIERPEHFSFSSKDAIIEFLLEKESTDKSYEGLVLRDVSNIRFKWKTKTYLALHHLRDNGNILHPNNIVPLLLNGEFEEVLATMPEVKTAFLEANKILVSAKTELKQLWDEAKDIPEQKDFAIKIKYHPLASILFTLRKTKGPTATEKDFELLWRNHDELLIKKLFDKKLFTFDLLNSNIT